MSWAIGWDKHWERDIGYGVPAYCDHPHCNAVINRGLSYVCGNAPYGGDRGCGLYFCSDHLLLNDRAQHLCDRCYPRRRKPFPKKPDHPDWIRHKATDPSWAQWRAEQEKSR